MDWSTVTADAVSNISDAITGAGPAVIGIAGTLVAVMVIMRLLKTAK